jgi:hypothetical protein
MEAWRDVKGYEGLYQVSDAGNVRSLDRVSASGHSLKGKPRKLRMDKYGYLVVGLTLNGAMKYKKIHRLVAQAFVNNPDRKPQVNHINGVKTDNAPSNLEWCTTRENTAHARENGLLRRGAGVSTAKLTSDDVQHIRWLAAEGVKHSVLAREWAVTQTNVRHIVAGRSWRHV